MSTKTEHILAHARPLGDRLIVKTDHVPEKTPGGIVLPSKLIARTRKQVGTVTAVGEGRKLRYEPEDDEYDEPLLVRMPMDVKVGDRVIFQMFAGDALDDPDYDGDESGFKILREEDVLAIVFDGEATDDN